MKLLEKTERTEAKTTPRLVKYRVYTGGTRKSVPLGAGTLSVLAVLIMFGMLPFTQFLAGLKKPDMQVREFDVTVPPPQFMPPEPPPPEPPPEQEPPPDMEAPPPQLSLSQLNMSLNTGVGDALAGDFSLGEVGVDASETMEEISLFEISDLDETPTIQRRPPMQFTPRMKREKKAGVISMEGTINPDGTVTITQVKSAIDRDYEELFKRYFQSIVYSKPSVGGKPVSARVYFEVPVSWES